MGGTEHPTQFEVCPVAHGEVAQRYVINERSGTHQNGQPSCKSRSHEHIKPETVTETHVKDMYIMPEYGRFRTFLLPERVTPDDTADKTAPTKHQPGADTGPPTTTGEADGDATAHAAGGNTKTQPERSKYGTAATMSPYWAMRRMIKPGDWATSYINCEFVDVGAESNIRGTVGTTEAADCATRLEGSYYVKMEAITNVTDVSAGAELIVEVNDVPPPPNTRYTRCGKCGCTVGPYMCPTVCRRCAA